MWVELSYCGPLTMRTSPVENASVTCQRWHAATIVANASSSDPRLAPTAIGGRSWRQTHGIMMSRRQLWKGDLTVGAEGGGVCQSIESDRVAPRSLDADACSATVVRLRMAAQAAGVAPRKRCGRRAHHTSGVKDARRSSRVTSCRHGRDRGASQRCDGDVVSSSHTLLGITGPSSRDAGFMPLGGFLPPDSVT